MVKSGYDCCLRQESCAQQGKVEVKSFPYTELAHRSIEVSFVHSGWEWLSRFSLGCALSHHLPLQQLQLEMLRIEPGAFLYTKYVL